MFRLTVSLLPPPWRLAGPLKLVAAVSSLEVSMSPLPKTVLPCDCLEKMRGVAAINKNICAVRKAERN
jgi:hypothetical protein